MNISILSNDSALCIKLNRILISLDKLFKISVFEDLYDINEKLSEDNHALVFYDFRLLGSVGIELILTNINPSAKVILIHTLNEHSDLKPHKHVFDFILTPVTKAKILQVFEKLQEYTIPKPNYLNGTTTIQTNSLHPAIILSSNYGFERIHVEQIIKIEASKSYSIFYMLDSNKKVSTRNLGYFEKLLPDDTFFRVHHHSIINSLHIKSYHSSGMLELSSEIFQSVSKRRRHIFLTKFRRIHFNRL